MTIPANLFVNVQPNVLGAGGNELVMNGLAMTRSARMPTSTVLSFSSAATVAAFFGQQSAEAIAAGGGTGLGSGYFGGFNNSNRRPGSMLFARYVDTDVAAWLRGGDISGLTLAQLQAITGSLTVTMDGYPRVVSSLDLSGASSFSAAAGLIETALNGVEPQEAEFTASVGATFTASAGSPSTQLVVTAVTGYISAGDVVSGTGITAGTKIVSQLSGTTGDAGTYVLSQANTASAASCSTESNVLVVTAVASGTLSPGQTLGDLTGEPVISSQSAGTSGGIGRYVFSGDPQSAASGSMTASATELTVTYDSVSGALLLTSGIAGAESLAAFATGSAAAALALTSVTGAMVSQGADAMTPAENMNEVIAVTKNWASFFTVFDPDDGSGNDNRLALAAWNNTQNNRFAYLPSDSDASAVASVPASGCLMQRVASADMSGTAGLWQPDDMNLPAFVAGAIASIDFTQRNGRITFAFKGQTGLVAGVTSEQAAVNLGGNPQTQGDFGNGYNYYGAVATAAQNFLWLQRGTVSGPFRWLDGYINQIWFNNRCQLALMDFLSTVKSVPYNDVGYGLLEQALADPIKAGLNFGAFGPGSISEAQKAEVNSAAGLDISDTLQTQGWYLQILDAEAAVRASRGSPPMTFWYLDRGSVQAINLVSVAVQ